MKKDKAMEENLVRSELGVEILKVLNNFKSKEVPGYKINKKDIIHVMSSIIARKTE